MNKLLSGRYILTVLSGATFMVCAIQQIIDSQAVASILTAVFISYFQRQDRKPNGEENETIT